MPVVRWSRGGVPASIAENSGPADWVANLSLSGDVGSLVRVETTGPLAAFFSATWNAALGLATIRPAARLDFEAFSAAGALPQAEFGLAFVFNDGSRQVDATPIRLAVLDRDDTAPAALSFSSGGTVAAGAIGAAIGTLSVTDPDTAGPFHYSFTWEDDWRFEVVDGVLELRDGISLGWDDMPSRPVLIQVSDGTQSAAFAVTVAVTEPDHGPSPYVPTTLAQSQTVAGITLAGAHEALTTRPAADATAVKPQPGDLHQVLLDSGQSVWLAPGVDRVRFADGWLDTDPHGTAAQAAALHRAVLGEDADGLDLAPLVADLRAGTGWVGVARHLLDSAPSLAALDDAAFVRTLAQAALGAAAPDAELLGLHTARLTDGVASRAQVAADIALSPTSLAHLAADAPAGHWVAEAFDADAPPPARPEFADLAPAAAPPAGSGFGWFM